MISLINSLRNLIKRAVIGLVIDQVNFAPKVQCSSFGDTVTAELINPYGLTALPPSGERAISFSILGQENNIAALPSSTKTRLKGLEQGEVAVGNFSSNAYMAFFNSGIAKINAYYVIIAPESKLTSIEGALEVTEGFTSLSPDAKAVARVGDQIQVTTGSGTYIGTIISGSENTKVT